MAKRKLTIERTGHRNPQTEKMGFSARVVTRGTAGYEDIVAEACHNTTLYKGEAKLGLELCMEAAVRMLAQGYIVDLGPLGRLYPTCSGQWAERAEDLVLENVVPTIRYRPSREAAEAMRGAALQWARDDE